MQQRLLIQARSDPFPARDGGCATPLAAKENPFLASASSSRILEHVSECITTHSLTDIPLGSLAPQPSALTWATAPRRPSEPGSRQPGQGWEQGQGQQHTGSPVARACWLCPFPQDPPLSHGQCSCPHHTLSRGARCCRAPIHASGTNATWGKPWALPIPDPSPELQRAVRGEGREDLPW